MKTDCKDHGKCPSKPMEANEIQVELSKLPGWSLLEQPSRIYREFKFKNFIPRVEANTAKLASADEPARGTPASRH